MMVTVDDYWQTVIIVVVSFNTGILVFNHFSNIKLTPKDTVTVTRIRSTVQVFSQKSF
jgi:hypothetical protein